MTVTRVRWLALSPSGSRAVIVRDVLPSSSPSTDITLPDTVALARLSKNTSTS